MLENARELGLPVQVNTTITRRNFQQLDRLAALLADQGIAMWSAFFLMPVGRGVEEQRITAEEMEAAFEKLWHHAQVQPYSVKTTEAPHYRRFVLQQGGDPLAGPQGSADDWSAPRSSRTAGRGRRQRASCSSATAAKSIRPASCPCCAAGSPTRMWSTPTRTIPRFARCAIPINSTASAASANSARLRRQPCPRLRRDRRSAGLRTRLCVRTGRRTRSELSNRSGRCV